MSVKKYVAVSCPEGCGLSFAGPAAEVRRIMADHKRVVHGGKR
jgi:hypothetical protein